MSRSRPRATLPPPPLTEAGLAALYNDCNRTRFGGRLPRAVVEWHQPPPGMMASTHPNSALGPSIWIHPLFAAVSGKAWVRRTLLHEMCHVEVGTDGGDVPRDGHAVLAGAGGEGADGPELAKRLAPARSLARHGAVRVRVRTTRSACLATRGPDVISRRRWPAPASRSRARPARGGRRGRE